MKNNSHFQIRPADLAPLIELALKNVSHTKELNIRRANAKLVEYSNWRNGLSPWKKFAYAVWCDEPELPQTIQLLDFGIPMSQIEQYNKELHRENRSEYFYTTSIDYRKMEFNNFIEKLTALKNIVDANRYSSRLFTIDVETLNDIYNWQKI